MKKGELIFVIEPDTYQDNVTQAEAALKTSKAQLDYARSNYERMKEAAKSGAVSQIQVLQAQSTAQEMEASVRNSEAELNTARTNLSYCYIRAPFDGRITRPLTTSAIISTERRSPSRWLPFIKMTKCSSTSI